MLRLEDRCKPSTVLFENTSKDAQIGDLRHFSRLDEASLDVIAKITLLLLMLPCGNSLRCSPRSCSVKRNASLKRASSGGGSTSGVLDCIGFAFRMRLRRLSGAKVSADEIAVA